MLTRMIARPTWAMSRWIVRHKLAVVGVMVADAVLLAALIALAATEFADAAIF